MAMKKHKEATAQEQSCAVASFLFFRVERTDQNEDSADHIDCRDRSRARRPLGSSGSALVGEGGFEPPKSLTTDLQSAPFGHSGILPYLIELLVKKWSWWTDSNPRPADYKSAALPAELYQHLSNEQVVYYQTSIRLSTGNFKKGGILLYAGKRHHDSVHAVCSLCAQDIYAGETLWYRNGVTVCADCFPRFAREALRSFEYISGEASTL